MLSSKISDFNDIRENVLISSYYFSSFIFMQMFNLFTLFVKVGNVISGVNHLSHQHNFVGLACKHPSNWSANMTKNFSRIQMHFLCNTFFNIPQEFFWSIDSKQSCLTYGCLFGRSGLVMCWCLLCLSKDPLQIRYGATWEVAPYTRPSSGFKYALPSPHGRLRTR